MQIFDTPLEYPISGIILVIILAFTISFPIISIYRMIKGFNFKKQYYIMRSKFKKGQIVWCKYAGVQRFKAEITRVVGEEGSFFFYEIRTSIPSCASAMIVVEEKQLSPLNEFIW